jgi:hypothetical protein
LCSFPIPLLHQQLPVLPPLLDRILLIFPEWTRIMSPDFLWPNNYGFCHFPSELSSLSITAS